MIQQKLTPYYRVLMLIKINDKKHTQIFVHLTTHIQKYGFVSLPGTGMSHE